MRKHIRKSFAVMLFSSLVLATVSCGVCSCKAWRTITTSASYVQQNDSANQKVTTTISTKTVEEYQGVKKK